MLLLRRTAVWSWIAATLTASCAPHGAPSSSASALVAYSDERVADGLAAVSMHASLPASLDSLMQEAIAERVTPGAALVVGRYGRIAFARGYGRTDWAATSPEVTDSTLYDLASLTKVIATTTAAMILEDEGRLDLDRPVRDYLPAFGAADKRAITVRQLLVHRSGMTTSMLHAEARGRDEYLSRISAHPLSWEPDSHTQYSDWNMITLQFVIERITGQSVDAFLGARVFGPLGMRDTGYTPDPSLLPRIAPTETQDWRGGQVHGVVHDENAWAIGGVAGHAGLFSSTRDLAVFGQMLLDGGEHAGLRILAPETVARWTARQGSESSRGLGWDTPWKESSAGRFFSPRSFGHTGFTGTSIWIDPQKDLFVILLTNRVNPTRDNPRIFPLRRAVADIVQLATTDGRVRDWEAAYVEPDNR